ncbi:hypothetical protein STENM327S_07693 [Streptomyces tendae]
MAAGVAVEGEVGAGGVLAGAEPAAGELRDPAPGAQGGVDAAGHDETGALADLPAGLGDRVEAAGLVADDAAAGALHAVADGDLAAVDGVEPGEGLVRGHVLATLAPQLAQLVLAELEAAGRARGDHAHVEGGQLVGAYTRVGQRPVGGGEGEPGHPVGLRDEPARQVLLCGEPGDLAGEFRRVAGRVEAGEAADAAAAPECGCPVLARPEPGRRGDAESGHHDARRSHTRFLSGSVSTIALWNPPNPLPTVSTVSVSWSRASSGT